MHPKLSGRDLDNVVYTALMRLSFRSIRYGSWIYWGFFSLSPLAALLLNVFVPAPGIAVAFLAVAAFVATFRDEIPHRQKLVWTLAVFGLFIAEIRAVSEERRTQSLNAEKENKNFQDNLDTLKAALDRIESLKRSINTESDLQNLMSKEQSAQTIEKGQYVYALAHSNRKDERLDGASWQLEIMNSGDKTLNDVFVVVRDFQDRGKDESRLIGTLRSSKMGPVSTGKLIKPGFYLIEVSTRYNEFQEVLQILDDPHRPGGYIQKAWIKRPFDGTQIWGCCPPMDCQKRPCPTS